MRVRKLIGLAVVLVALAMVVNALAYTKATVTNTTSFYIDTTDKATLAIDTSVGSASPGLTVDTANGYLDLQISDRIQPNAVYMYGPVFQIVNKSAGSVTVSVDPISINGATLSLTTDVNGDFAYTGGSLSSNGNTGALYLKLSVPDNYKANGGTFANGTYDGTTAKKPGLVVHGN